MLTNNKITINLLRLPTYAGLFFARYFQGFLTSFILLTIVSMLSALISYAGVELLSNLLSSMSVLTITEIFKFYLPIYVLSFVLKEALDYITRRYGEAFPAIYRDKMELGFYSALINSQSEKLFTFSPEKLTILISRYCGHVETFLSEWFWGTSRKIPIFIVVLIVLYRQDPIIFWINLFYLVGFLWLSFGISKRFAPYAKDFAEKSIASGTLQSHLTRNIPAVKRINSQDFLILALYDRLERKWRSLSHLKTFHAVRWLLQLNLFNALYIGSLFYGAYQVKMGQLPLGYLVLIKYAFDRLWDILVYAIEYRVSLVQQKEDAHQLLTALSDLQLSDIQIRQKNLPKDWQNLSLEEVSISFPSKEGSKILTISIPQFSIFRADKIGVLGSSGQGKTTLLLAIMNLLRFDGIYICDGSSIKENNFTNEDMTLISGSDPLFPITLYDNIVLGKDISKSVLDQVLEGTRVTEFINNLDYEVGSPTLHLSAGQLQRVRLARGLLQNSSIFLMDEPFEGIDKDTKQKIYGFLRDFLKDKTLILVTHNQEDLMITEKTYSFENHTISS